MSGFAKALLVVCARAVLVPGTAYAQASIAGPRVGLNVGYFRRWLRDFVTTDNRAVGPGDFDEFSVVVPKVLSYGRTRVEPGKLYGDRSNQRTNVGVDLYNALNANPVTTYNQTFGSRWLTPTQIMPARFVKFSLTIDF